MRFVIVGPGALGSVIGATLSRQGHDVTLLGRRSPHLQILREQGLRIEAPDGTSGHVAIAATDDPAVVTHAETVIVLVKAGDTIPAMTSIRPYIRADQNILTLQNGLGNAKKIRSALGSGPRVLVGVTSQAAMQLEPGAVRHAGKDRRSSEFWTSETPPPRPSSPGSSLSPGSQRHPSPISSTGFGGKLRSTPPSMG